MFTHYERRTNYCKAVYWQKTETLQPLVRFSFYLSFEILRFEYLIKNGWKEIIVAAELVDVRY